MAALIREPPTRRRTRCGGSACARRATSSTCPRSRARRAAAATGRRPVSPATQSIEEITDFIRSEFASAHRAARRAPEARPGLVLVDKPAGPSSFAVVTRLRDGTGARAGHAGTLDPFATGLLLVLLGSATRLARYFVGLDKRYVTEVDLSARTATGDRGGRARSISASRLRCPRSSSGSTRSAERSSCRCPAASAVKIGGERAYRLARRGVAVEMPRAALAGARARASSTYTAGWPRSTCSSAPAPMSGRSRTRSAGTAATLRRTQVGPFSVASADENRLLPPVDALPFLPTATVPADVARAIRQGRTRVTDVARVVCDGELVAVNGAVLP